MHALIVVAHPDPRSLTHGVAAHLAEGITLADGGHSFEIADLTVEGFDPRFSAADIALHLRNEAVPADVAAEQARLDRADALVLVYPVYWWSMPGLLKGWIDRVFTNGWAYDDRSDAGLVKLLGRLPVHLVGLGGADAGTYTRRGYFGAMKTQIDHGIFDYCGAPVVTSELLLETGEDHATAHLEAARAIGRRLFDTSERHEATDAA
ncbi:MULTISPECIES: NAD(P)H-dependent oxidoreductase [Rhizobium]|uniref:NAD(P)H dehydrogenase (Quinone) n=1 Tax=Rhizobium esperanzae TaxID=1967781 RepID=A0A7W6ULK2_9HYPH|nr:MULTISPECIES: NAD(P)H-dependent oxidoreductase [Rhizobium]MBB4440414.1 NAD(P)H dehydrogenase (quinone) [Rhizobium esperanzae]MDH6203058.1 NAD(P)H dehydrogenase (quinone) [Rhizobium leguminosarum]